MPLKSCDWFDNLVLPKVDLQNKVFGRWTIKYFAGNRNRIVYWNCECECGNLSTISAPSLLNGKSKSCGCLRVELIRKRKYKKPEDIMGKKFGKLTVLKNLKNENGIAVCEVVCDCGNTKVVMRHHLISGNTQSCGCMQKDSGRNLMEKINERRE